ncbi:MAG: hypothetical protein PHP10_00365 [Candidatus Omnitrophica bacterium]|nr:hypothetical protein [Candidatus Omnitrophota bacterium]
MSKNKIIDYCHICLRLRELTFEHIPPRAAFNDRRVITLNFDSAIKLGPDEFVKGPINQRGSGGHTLCAQCNSYTGRFYGTRFVNWCYEAFYILIKSEGKPRGIYLRRAYPLEILKQIVSMFLSINPPEFARANPELVRFVLNKRLKFLPTKYRFFTYYNLGNKFRFSGIAARCDLKGDMVVLSEIGYTPFGYVLTLNSSPPDDRLFEITDFSRFDYDQPRELTIYPQVLPVHLLFPGDYRSRKQIQEDYIRNSKKIITPSH